MAGMSMTDPGTQARMKAQGFVYEPTLGGFVNGKSINPQTGRRYDGTDPNETSLDTADYKLGPDGTVQQNAKLRTVQRSPTANSSAYSSASSSYSSPSQSASSPNAMLQSKLEELWNANKNVQPQEAPQLPYDGETTAADNAYLAQSKERAGERLSSGMRTLASEMARRGISGSKIENGNARVLTRGAMGDMATAERDLVRQHEQRNQNIQDQNFNAKQAAFSANMAAQQSAQGRLSALLQYYGMAY